MITTIFLQGLLVGFIFGFLLQKGTVSKFETIVGQFLLTNFTVLKIMFTAIIIGGVGMFSLRTTHMIDHLPFDSLSLVGALVGGVVFGIGMTLFGYCPGTSIAAWAEGAHDAFFGILGMIVGAALFEPLYPYIYRTIKSAAVNSDTLSSYFNISPWLILIFFTIGAIFFFAFLEKKNL